MSESFLVGACVYVREVTHHVLVQIKGESCVLMDVAYACTDVERKRKEN